MAKAPSPSLDLTRGIAGKMLVAMPHLDDTPFEKSVCLICSHDGDHAFGVIVNKPMDDVSVADVVSELSLEPDETAQDQPVYFGGPVGMERGAVLHSLDYRSENTVQIGPETGLTATKDALEVICDDLRAPKNWILIMGHAGWDGGQLENEIKRNDWLNIDCDSALIFGHATKAWAKALSVLGISDLTQFDGNESPMARPN